MVQLGYAFSAGADEQFVKIYKSGAASQSRCIGLVMPASVPVSAHGFAAPYFHAATNLSHSVHFSEASTAFYDENAREYFDPEHSEDEDRFLLLGMSQNLMVLIYPLSHDHQFPFDQDFAVIVRNNVKIKAGCDQFPALVSGVPFPLRLLVFFGLGKVD